MKSLVNSINDSVTETLYGLNYAYPQLEYQVSHKVVLMPRLQDRKDKVSIICGGGSGHEPFAAGFVGNGMLTASVAGSIFAAPPSQHISYAIERITKHNNNGILMVIPNYTGDCLNFGIAIERARKTGVKVAELIVNDDCSIPDTEQGVAGQRGLSGMLFVIKIAGALAEKGSPLDIVQRTAEIVLQNTATYAVGLTACAIPANMNIKPLRVYSGVLVTSLNSAGVHITLLKLPEANKKVFLSYLDEPTSAPKWPGCAYSIPSESAPPIIQDKVLRKIKKIGIQIDSKQQVVLKQCLQSSCKSLIEKEAYINDLDRGCGDGDCGSTLKRLAADILQNLENFQLSYPSSVFHELAHTAEEQMGGTSGALYCLLFTSIATELILDQQNAAWTRIWARALRVGLNCLIKYGKARPGDRSMVDVINAVCEVYEGSLDKPLVELCEIIKTAAWTACESTKNMKPRVGRASYVKQEQYLQNVDAGAYGVATWVHAITDVIKNAKI
ncbi:triokinase/FMN cyclase-like isoform X3 [Osmia bicornis bicornis]|uniref:triokinase/FMN cyclase-like isoform X3 n=1 Tax=Osmia bicornis bicornis TaxID=1437191 RepID=UPI001EAF6BAD|nr:triokinase/FMN cyclase-like isoform X3 [Osmia bicornis bicornis]